MIGIVNYGMGNLQSVRNAFDFLGIEATICDVPEDLKHFDKLILPGVGAFKDCIANLKNKGFVSILNEEVLDKKKPILGICLGMQVLASFSEEDGTHEGLGWIKGKVKRLDNKKNHEAKIPNIGWEDIHYKKESPLFKDLSNNPDFYFVHSYFMNCENETDVDAYYNFCGQKITASVRSNNIFGTQFHPEKSADHGRQILDNFLEWTP